MGEKLFLIKRRAPWALAWMVATLAVASPLKADLGPRLAVVAHALAANRAARQPVALGPVTAADGQAFADGERALSAALREALEGASGVTLRPESAQPAGQDLVLDGSYRIQGEGIQLTLRLHAAAGGATRWTRTLWIPYADLPATDAGVGEDQAPSAGGADPEPLGAPQPQRQAAEGMVVPTLPSSEARPRTARTHRPFHMDLSAGYQQFYPLNTTFQGVAGSRLDGLSLGMSIQDVFLADLVTYHADVNGQGTLQALDFYGLDLAVVAPWRLGPLTLYVGPGVRLGTLELDDSSLDAGAVGFGNNAFMGVAGIKTHGGPLGLDLRYSYDLASSYTGYHAVRLGAFYEFGE